MALFPISSDAIQLSTGTPAAADPFRNGIRLKSDNTVAYFATSGGLQSQNGFLLDVNGAVLYADATAGLPAGVVWRNGLPFDSSGALCVSTGPVATWINGIPFAANGAVSGAVAGGGGDPFYSNVSLLLHLDGANGSTTFTDNSPSPKTVTRAGIAAISTTQSQFGGASAVFSSAGDYLTSASNADFNFDGGDFTIEFWMRPNSVTSGATAVLIDRGDFSNFTPWAITQFNGSLRLVTSVTGSAWMVDIFSASVLTAGAWVHVAATRSGNVFRLFHNGVQIGTATAAGTLRTVSLPIGIGRGLGTSTGQYAGYIDEIRLTKGVARYTANFTPPTAAFPNS